jgi:hypothetical protein
MPVGGARDDPQVLTTAGYLRHTYLTGVSFIRDKGLSRVNCPTPFPDHDATKRRGYCSSKPLVCQPLRSILGGAVSLQRAHPLPQPHW